MSRIKVLNWNKQEAEVEYILKNGRKYRIKILSEFTDERDILERFVDNLYKKKKISFCNKRAFLSNIKNPKPREYYCEIGFLAGRLLWKDTRFEDAFVYIENNLKKIKFLNRQERLVMARRLATDGHVIKTLAQIGREMNLSRERIRKIELQALNKTDKFLKDNRIFPEVKKETQQPPDIE